MLPNWEFPPRFSRVETVLLSGGTGVPPEQEFYVVTLFKFTSFVPKGSTEFNFGIRQSVTATVPESGCTLGFLGIGMLSVIAWRHSLWFS
jgi:hypothetical protein